MNKERKLLINGINWEDGDTSIMEGLIHQLTTLEKTIKEKETELAKVKKQIGKFLSSKNTNKAVSLKSKVSITYTQGKKVIDYKKIINKLGEEGKKYLIKQTSFKINKELLEEDFKEEILASEDNWKETKDRVLVKEILEKEGR